MDSSQGTREPEFEIEKTQILVVEGRDELNFFSALLRHLGLSTIQVLPIGGKVRIREYLGLLTVSPGFDSVHSLGVVRDADDNPKAAFHSVRDALREAGVVCPRRPYEIAKGTPAVGVFILPGEGKPGMLEDLRLQAVADDPAIPCVEAFYECLGKTDLESPKNSSKARIHCFLSSRKEADLRLGEAAQKGYIDWTHPAFEPISRFLREMYLAKEDEG